MVEDIDKPQLVGGKPVGDHPFCSTSSSYLSVVPPALIQLRSRMIVFYTLHPFKSLIKLI